MVVHPHQDLFRQCQGLPFPLLLPHTATLDSQVSRRCHRETLVSIAIFASGLQNKASRT